MEQFIEKIISFFENTGVIEQFADHDIGALASNPWFMVPFLFIIGYMIFKQNWKDIVILGIIGGIWYFAGTPYAQTLIVGDEIQLEKVLPVVAGGAVALGVAIYLLIGRGD